MTILCGWRKLKRRPPQLGKDSICLYSPSLSAKACRSIQRKLDHPAELEDLWWTRVETRLQHVYTPIGERTLYKCPHYPTINTMYPL